MILKFSRIPASPQTELGLLLEFLAATLVAQLHAVVQQFLFLSQARVHVGRKCVGREEVCVRERDRVRVWKKVGRVELAACFNCWH